MRSFFDLLYDVRKLVEGFAFSGRKVMKSSAVRTWSEIAGCKTALRALLGRDEIGPEAASIGLEFFKCAGAIDKADDLPDCLFPKAFDTALGHHRDTVMKIKTHRLSPKECNAVSAVRILGRGASLT